jgi:hypothetical protein
MTMGRLVEDVPMVPADDDVVSEDEDALIAERPEGTRLFPPAKPNVVEDLLPIKVAEALVNRTYSAF